MVSTAQIVNSYEPVNMFAVFEFQYTVANSAINISANFIEGNVTGGILNQTQIFSYGTHGQVNAT